MKIRKTLYLITIIFVCISFSCQRGDEKKQSNLLSKQVVEDILLEIYLIEAKAKIIIFNQSTDKIRMELNHDMKNLFKKHNTNYEQFINSYSYYMSDGKISKKMMSDITNRLILMEAKYTGNTKLIDSLTIK